MLFDCKILKSLIIPTLYLQRFGPQMYFAKDSESVDDWDDDSITEDWENFTDDSSDVLSQYDNDNEVNKMELLMKSFPSDRINVELPNKDMQPLLADNYSTNKSIQSPVHLLTRHASAPNLASLTYETPIVDHSDKRKIGRGTNIKRKRIPNIMKLSFHG